MKNISLGIDIGGSHVSLAFLNLETRKIIENTYHRYPVNSQLSGEEIINNWATIIRKHTTDSTTLLAMAFPGPFDYSKGICYMKGQDKYNDLYGVNVKKTLAAATGIDSKNILFDNDAACFLRGEIFMQDQPDFDSVLGITIGTGLGAAITKEGRNITDANLWRHPFKEGIAEDYFSARWLIKKYMEKTGNTLGNAGQLYEIAINTDHPDKLTAISIFNELGINLASFIINVSLQMPLKKIIIGGGIAQSLHLYHRTIEETLKQAGFTIKVERSKYNDVANITGAAICHHPFFKVKPKTI